MHLTDGILHSDVLIATSVVGAVSLAASLRKIQEIDLAKVAVFSAVFFIASFIHVPVGVSSAHLLLGGIIGAALGIGSISAIFVALFLQALLFGFGGLSVLLTNTFIMGFPAYLVSYLMFIKFKNEAFNLIIYFLVGALSVAISALILAAILYINDKALAPSAIAILVAHIPLMIVEGIITAFAIAFTQKVSKGTVFVH